MIVLKNQSGKKTATLYSSSFSDKDGWQCIRGKRRHISNKVHLPAAGSLNDKFFKLVLNYTDYK